MRPPSSLLGPERLPTYNHLRGAITDWLADDRVGARKNGGKALAAVEGPNDEEEAEFEEVQVWTLELER